MGWISYEYEPGLSRWINLSRATDVGFAEKDGRLVAFVRLQWDDVGYTITVEDGDGIAAIQTYLTAHEFHVGRE